MNFAFTARLYDILRREPTFFTVRQAGPLDIVALVAVLSLLLPAAVLLVEIVARGISPRTGQTVHVGLVGLLATLIALAALRSLDLLPWPMLLAAAAACGGLAALLYVRSLWARSAVTVLWPALLIFPAWMLPGLAGADGLFGRFRSAGRRSPRRPSRARRAHYLR